jgi:hypothetical protein
MRFIPTVIHGFIDYIVGVLLLIFPWALDIDPMAPKGLIFIISGLLALIYSALTKYELGVLRVIPMQLHLALDMFSGLVVAFSPWLFGFSDEIFLPHLIVGLFEIIAAITTKETTGIDNNPVRPR